VLLRSIPPTHNIRVSTPPPPPSYPSLHPPSSSSLNFKKDKTDRNAKLVGQGVAAPQHPEPLLRTKTLCLPVLGTAIQKRDDRKRLKGKLKEFVPELTPFL
jgi:hypothetical protein